MATQTCWSWLGLLTSAKTNQTGVTVVYDLPGASTALPTYANAPPPYYVMLGLNPACWHPLLGSGTALGREVGADYNCRGPNAPDIVTLVPTENTGGSTFVNDFSGTASGCLYSCEASGQLYAGSPYSYAVDATDYLPIPWRYIGQAAATSTGDAVAFARGRFGDGEWVNPLTGRWYMTGGEQQDVAFGVLTMGLGGFGALEGTAVRGATTTVDQYALKAVEDGFFPVMRRGFREPQGGVWLNVGDVWKFGTTKNPATRYSQAFLDRWGLRYERQSSGELADALSAERVRIVEYLNRIGALPPGNKIVR